MPFSIQQNPPRPEKDTKRYLNLRSHITFPYIRAIQTVPWDEIMYDWESGSYALNNIKISRKMNWTFS